MLVTLMPAQGYPACDLLLPWDFGTVVPSGSLLGWFLSYSGWASTVPSREALWKQPQLLLCCASVPHALRNGPACLSIIHLPCWMSVLWGENHVCVICNLEGACLASSWWSTNIS